MLKWIKEQFNYRAKYKSLLQCKDKAAQDALFVLGQYEHLCANLPYDHELSTRRHWEEFANRKLWNKYQAQTRDYNHLRDAHQSMTQLWEENITKYGFNMYVEWQPIETAPKDGTVIIVYGRFSPKENVQTVFYQTAAWIDNKWLNAANSWLGDVTHWMPLPKAPLI